MQHDFYIKYAMVDCRDGSVVCATLFREWYDHQRIEQDREEARQMNEREADERFVVKPFYFAYPREGGVV